MNADVPLTAGLADSDIPPPTRDLTTVPVAYPARFQQKNTAVFLIELNTLQVAECIILSPLLNQGKAARFWKKFLSAHSRSFSDRYNGCDGASLSHCVSVAFFHSTSQGAIFT